MNKARKAEIQSILNNQNLICAATEIVLNQERDAMRSMEDKWSGTDRYQTSEAAVDSLEEALDHMRDAATALEESLGI